MLSRNLQPVLPKLLTQIDLIFAEVSDETEKFEKLYILQNFRSWLDLALAFCHFSYVIYFHIVIACHYSSICTDISVKHCLVTVRYIIICKLLPSDKKVRAQSQCDRSVALSPSDRRRDNIGL